MSAASKGLRSCVSQQLDDAYLNRGRTSVYLQSRHEVKSSGFKSDQEAVKREAAWSELISSNNKS